ncbi:hypothetical protein B0J13DRAFT_566498 [Dactylonectria estremocensis]|uniref:Uncharacterized protein n=1 Tax=Dactylonectria estremocensis TaxID=1079267 RepID=A0A9P9IK98_9HYPO|nr:hypothetical protein B0J13DRAFT_566498 [Dactylonectria estremocensis]
MKLTLLVLPLIAPVFATPTVESVDDIEWLEGPGYIVPDNITIGPFDDIDPTIPGIRLVGDFEDFEARNESTLDVELSEGDIEARADSVKTNFFIGKKRAEYGCNQSVRPIFQKAVEALCHNGGCDEGSSYYYKVKWSNVAGSANLKVKVSGFYYGNVRHRLIDAAKSLVVTKAFTSYTKAWQVQIGLGGAAILRCSMTRFPNYVQIDRRVNGNMRDQLKIVVTPPEAEKQAICMLLDTLSKMAGALGGAAGGFFGIVNPPGC